MHKPSHLQLVSSPAQPHHCLRPHPHHHDWGGYWQHCSHPGSVVIWTRNKAHYVRHGDTQTNKLTFVYAITTPIYMYLCSFIISFLKGIWHTHFMHNFVILIFTSCPSLVPRLSYSITEERERQGSEKCGCEEKHGWQREPGTHWFMSEWIFLAFQETAILAQTICIIFVTIRNYWLQPGPTTTQIFRAFSRML